MAGHIADDHGQTLRPGRENVVKIARHHPGPGLVNAADVEPLVDRQSFRRQPGRPSPGSELFLGQDFLGSTFQLGALLGQAGLG